MPDVPTITLNDGRLMPQIGFGTYKLHDQAAMESALALGYPAIDTASIYENEAAVGAAVRATDRTIFVTSKLWNEDQGYDAARRAFDASFDRLGLDWLDLYLIHWPTPAHDRIVETWKALVALRDEGRVRSIGVSNFRIVDLERIIDDTGVIPAVNQIELHPSFQQVELRAWHEANGIATTSWSPLGQGDALADPAIAAIAEKHGRTPAQVVLRWHVENGLVAIPKASSRDRQAQNLAIFDFTLDQEDMDRITALDRADGRIGPDPADFD